MKERGKWQFWRKKQKESVSLNGYASNEIEIVTPGSIIERIPSTANANEYWVEIGDNVGGSRYVRSFFLEFTGRTTWLGMLEPILMAKGEAEVDMSITIEPVESDARIMQIATRMADIEVDIEKQANKARIAAMRREYYELSEQMGRLQVNMERLFRVIVTVNISADDPSKVKKSARLLQKRMSGMGIRFKAADTKQLDALRHSIGISARSEFSKYANEMETSNVADLFPYGYGGISHRTGILLGLDNYNRPVFYDAWHLNLENANCLIFGRSGAGKSNAVKVLTSRSLIEGINTAIIDPDGEFELLVLARGGVYIKLAAGSQNEEIQRINIYDVEEEEDDRGRVFVNLKESMDAILAVLYKMIRVFDKDALTGDVKVALKQSLRELYEIWGINSDPQSLYKETDEGFVRKTPPVLSDHYRLMQEEKYSDLHSILKYIKEFTIEGGDPSQSIFDGQSTFSISDCDCFGLSLKGLDKEIMRPLGHLASEIFVWEKFMKKNRKTKKRIIHDEAQEAMKNPEEAEWMENGYRRVRKLNGSMCLVTQGFEVLLNVPQGMGILKNSPTILLLKQETIDIEAVSGKFNLSEGEALFLLSATKGNGILKVGNESTKIFVLNTPEERWLYSTDVNEFNGEVTA